MTRLANVLFLAVLLPATALAQTSAETWNGLPDRFQIDTGYFRVSGESVLRYNGDEVDFNDDLGVEPKADTFWLDATWRLGRRHQVKVGYTRITRERANRTLTRDFEWGGTTYSAGLSASATTGADILGGYYRFSVFRDDRFEIGPTVGIGELWIRAGIKATGTVSGPGGSPVEETRDRSTSTASITGAVGAFATAWATKRLAVRGDFLYIKVSPGETDASITDWRIGADYYLFRHAGLGIQYKYNSYSYQRGVLSSTLGGDVTYEGVQVFASFLF